MIFKNQRQLEVVDSTNSLLKAEAETGIAREGAVVRAEHQIAGKGRLSRTWDAPPGKGLLFSFLIYPDISLNHLSLMALLTSLGVIDALNEYHENQQKGLDQNPEFQLKWPNDILADNRKICGILCESGIDPEGKRFVVCGVGLNVNQTKVDFAPEYRDRSTSLFLIYGKKNDRDDLQSLILRYLDLYYQKVKTTGSSWIASYWLKRAGISQKHITIRQLSECLNGTVTGINEDGSLRLGMDDGSERTIYSGDVSF